MGVLLYKLSRYTANLSILTFNVCPTIGKRGIIIYISIAINIDTLVLVKIANNLAIQVWSLAPPPFAGRIRQTMSHGPDR